MITNNMIIGEDGGISALEASDFHLQPSQVIEGTSID